MMYFWLLSHHYKNTHLQNSSNMAVADKEDFTGTEIAIMFITISNLILFKILSSQKIGG